MGDVNPDGEGGTSPSEPAEEGDGVSLSSPRESSGRQPTVHNSHRVEAGAQIAGILLDILQADGTLGEATENFMGVLASAQREDLPRIMTLLVDSIPGDGSKHSLIGKLVEILRASQRQLKS
eukprot:CAMPEP_0197614688 /NCGR_PEP_ID=MMETSP1326-20131121/59653_1 /TAXON_ID=1155430 /ORGANISM="Genus nov. species nov., Strain RCC2288" /LENGTH=121 /DNA_ID=CAMNT_0043183565 /DNA_START=13 /DNA_END=378 /DNA_ORIENTATION=-